MSETPSAVVTDPAVRHALEIAAAGSGCIHGYDEFVPHPCSNPACIHCRASAVLPELRCKCGEYQLDRSSPSMWDKPINHAPDLCAPFPMVTHCAACKQPLPSGGTP